MRVYIAGPMTGIPLFNFPAFDAARDRWKEAGHDVISPADLTRSYWREQFGEDFDPASTRPDIAAGGDIYREFLKEDVRAITECDGIALLSGWRKSKGVALELTVARGLGLIEFDAETLEPMQGETILQEAQRLVHGDRGAAYGHPLDDYTRTGAMWGAILHDWAKLAAISSSPRAIPAKLAALCMVAVKISREVHLPKRDNRTDMAGYAECVDMIDAEQRRRDAIREAA